MIDSLPKRVFVGLYEFQMFAAFPGTPDLICKGVVCDGLTDVNERTIAIDASLPLKRLVNVVLHECIHTLNWSKDLEDGASEETFTTNMADALTEFWLDNPRLIAWLNKAFKQIKKEQKGE